MAVLALAVFAFAAVLAYAVWLDLEIRQQFEGRRWALPARVFSRPLELYASKALPPQSLVDELKLLRYHSRNPVDEPGEYHRSGNTVTVYTRGFPFWDEVEPERLLRIGFRDNQVEGVYNDATHADLGVIRLEPVPIANIYPTHNEDRMLVQMSEVPPLLISALLTVEDRKFFHHRGLDPYALARALLANLKAGHTVQGGSTLTQQLVKNFFLSNERTIRRKFNEALMAWLLEWHYSKQEILEAYLNEVFLGQDKQRSIHGFGLASQFYFERRLRHLRPEQIALLVAMVKGPSYYDPRRHPERAKQRRDWVLDTLVQQGHLSRELAEAAKARRLGVSPRAPSGVTPFPAYLQLVRKQLQRDYREEDLRDEGLMIFTTLDPLIQLKAERALVAQLNRLERPRPASRRGLQGAMVVTDIESGEVIALVGDRNPRFAGYNRALDARRPIGSLIKPVVYLTALSQPRQYNLVSRLDDAPFALKLSNGNEWAPLNYDHEYHGQVSLQDALVQSYNVPTARLGLSLGIDRVATMLRKLGLGRDVPRYPALLLGAVELSPYEVSQIYQSLASGGGYRVPLKAIREVVTRDGKPLQHYPLNLEYSVDPAAAYLITAALYEVTQRGTASRLKVLLAYGLRVAGKTGTTDDLRDSWFAGYSAEHLAVVWIGEDDNRPTGLTGASGALPVWADLMDSIPTKGLDMVQPANVEWLLVDPVSGLIADPSCQGAEWIPFIKDSGPRDPAPCARGINTTMKSALNWITGKSKD
jgi:penicillin-binding protein 1B